MGRQKSIWDKTILIVCWLVSAAGWRIHTQDGPTLRVVYLGHEVKSQLSTVCMAPKI